MRYRKGSVWMLALLAAGCKPAANAEPAVPASESTPAQTVETSTPEIDKSFRKGMPYVEMRKQLLAAGWLPLRDPKCWENLGDNSSVCNQLPEIESCSDDGHCVMRFANSKDLAKAQFNTEGRYTRWNAPGEEQTLQIKSWRFSRLGDIPAWSVDCPSHDFDAFLKAFASDEKIKRAFTAPLVKVMELQTDDDEGFYIEKEGYNPRPVYVVAADYRDFNVTYKDGAFHFVNHKGAMESSPLPLSVKQEGEQTRFVSYQLNMSEGNSYRFEDRGSCWYLIEDPESPTP